MFLHIPLRSHGREIMIGWSRTERRRQGRRLGHTLCGPDGPVGRHHADRQARHRTSGDRRAQGRHGRDILVFVNSLFHNDIV